MSLARALLRIMRNIGGQDSDEAVLFKEKLRIQVIAQSFCNLISEAPRSLVAMLKTGEL